MKTIRPMNTERQKTAAKFSLAALLFTACSLLFLPGCQNPLQSIETPQTTGAGTFSLTIGGAARTIVPVLSVDRFERFAIAFEPAYGCEAGNAGFSYDDWEPGHGASPSAPILLSVGFWDVTVTAFTATDDEYPAAVGFILGLEMVAGESVNENIVLGPVIDGEGAFSWRDITFPEIVRMAGMEIFEWYDWNIGERLYAIELVADGDPVGGHPYRSLYAGQYFVLFTLRGEDDDEMMEISHILHIYRNIETELPAGMFADFAFPGPVILLYIAEQIAILQGKAEPPLGHTLTIDFANEQIAPQVLYFGGREIAITLTGGVGGDTLSLSDPGAMFTVGEGVTLILDGVELRGMADNHSALVLVEEDGHLVMLAGSMITGNTNISDTFVGGGVTVNSGGTFDMYAGEISGNNTAALGGGVANAGAFTLRDGVISENTADWGGGVYNRNTLSIYGGLISENIAAFGGGVFNNRADGTFNMHDGIISENTADMGGGVFNWATGTFNMHGGVIAINNADVGNGGGVANQAAAFNMHGGTISENTTGGDGGGVANWASSTFTMYNGIISGNTANRDGSAGGGVANGTSSIFTMHDGIISENTADFGGGVFNLAASTFNMHGGVITINNADLGAGGGVANSGDGTFNMYDGIISENTASMGGGVANWGDGTFTMYSGIISSNEAMNHDGGGVFNQGTFTMRYGAISNNETLFWGGGVANNAGGSFHMHGGTISGNSAGNDGGGVFNFAGGTFNMYNGTISENNAVNAGGGVANLINGRFRMHDGTISDNEAGPSGGGVFNYGTGWFTMSGGVISGNTANIGGGVNNQGGAVFIMGGGLIHGVNAGTALGNTASSAGAALVNIPGPANSQIGFGALNPDHTLADGALLFSSNTHEFTVDVDNGDAVLVNIQNLGYAGLAFRSKAYFDGEWYNLSGWFFVPATGTWAFNFPTTPGNWTIGLEFAPVEGTSVLVGHAVSYTVTRNLVRGVNTISFNEFTPVAPPTTVTAITITGIPFLYLGRGGVADLFVLDGSARIPIHVAVSITDPWVNFNLLDMEPRNDVLEIEFRFPPWDEPESIYTAEVHLTAGLNTIPFGNFNRIGGLPLPLITSITVADVGAYLGTEIDIEVFTGTGFQPVGTQVVGGDSVTFPINITWQSGEWPIRLTFWSPVNGGWALVGAYLGFMDLVSGANTVALADFDNITPTDTSANAAPFGGAIEGRTPPTEMRTPRLDRPSQPETRERQTPRVDERTSPADRFMRLDERVLPADGLMRIDEPTPFTDGLILHERLDAPSLEMDLDWQQLRQPRLMPQESLWPRR